MVTAKLGVSTRSMTGHSTLNGAAHVSFEVRDWLRATRSLHLTIADVEALEENGQLDCVCLCRSFMEVTCDPQVNREGVAQRPAHFFRNACRLLLTKKTPPPVVPIAEVSVLTADGSLQQSTVPVTGGVTFAGDRAPPARTAAFEPDIEYEAGRFFPLCRAHLMERDPYTRRVLGPMAGQHWGAFSKATRLGWRGAAIPVSRLTRAPRVFWTRDALE
jgi:hypothetical protein